MADDIYVFNCSNRFNKKVLSDVVEDLSPARQLQVEYMDGAEFIINFFFEDVFEPKREQVNYFSLLEKINSIDGIGSIWKKGKLIIVDVDLYADGTNWCYGSFHPTPYGLGYIMISTARLSDDTLARQILRHELGHMFGAPNRLRTNTTNNLGPHCINELCTMQQKTNHNEAIRYAHAIKDSGLSPFCPQCINDMIEYVPFNKPSS